ncbi:hypothetical protein V6Z11_A07G092500 [Gossypium hirsutum]
MTCVLRVQNLRTYLGVPLFHDRTTHGTLGFVVEKVQSKLNNWDARQLSFVGKATLAHPVLLSILNCFMQSMKIPKGVCEEIERIVTQFLWGTANDSVYQPRGRGGLGFRHLGDQNTSFLLKLGFNRTSKDDALWVHVLRSNYRCTGPNLPGPN